MAWQEFGPTPPIYCFKKKRYLHFTGDSTGEWELLYSKMPPKTRKTGPRRSQDVSVTQGENSHPIDHEVHHEDTNPPPPTVMFDMIKALQVSQHEVVGMIKELKDEKNSRNHREPPEGEVELNKKDNTV